MRKLGSVLAMGGFGVGVGYLLYWFFRLAAEFMPLPLKIAIAAVGIGLILLLISIGRERYIASKEEKFKEVEK